MKKGGLSTIVITLIIILLSLVAVGVVWAVVNNLIKDNSTEVGTALTKLTMNLELKKVYEDQGKIYAEVKRNSGAGDLTKIEFIVYTLDDSEIIIKDSSIKELESKNFILELSKLNIAEVTKISIAPVFKLSDGTEKIGDILDTYYIGTLEGISPEEEPSAEECSDGTLYDQCSITKPKYCDNGNLIDKASTCGCPIGFKVSGDQCLDVVIITLANEQVVKTFDFESDTSGWQTSSWDPSAVFTWDNIVSHSGSKSLKISLSNRNDAQWYYTFNLDPNKFYRFAGYAKGENIVNQEGTETGVGGRLEDDYDGWWGRRSNIMGTYDWKKMSLIFPGSSIKNVQCRLGYFGNTVTGTAWFDDLTLTSDPLTRYEGGHIYFMLEDSDLSLISEAKMKQEVIDMDKVYEAYYNLVGSNENYGTQKIGIISVPVGDCSYCYATCCHPIALAQTVVKNELRMIDSGYWPFGLLHETGHSFDSCNWGCDWSGEFWANFKTYYAVEMLNANVHINGRYYTGANFINWWKTDSPESYDNSFAKGTFAYDGLVYKFIEIKNQIGWEPFKQTFRYFTSLSSAPATKLDKLNLFINKLSEYSGQNVRSMFTDTEWNIMMTEFSD